MLRSSNLGRGIDGALACALSSESTFAELFAGFEERGLVRAKFGSAGCGLA
jgi:hypothetical protein